MTRRLVLPEGLLGEGEIPVSGPPLHYLSHVLRLRPGNEVELLDGSGRRVLARLESIARDRAVVRVLEELPGDPMPARELRLVYGLSRGKRTDWVLQKATELGVDALYLATCHRSVKRPDQAPEKLERWSEIIAQAARQCGRARFPVLHPSQPLAEALEPVPGDGIGLVAHPGGEALLGVEQKARAGAGPIIVAVGPEGGFTDEEAALARERGYRQVSLGPNTLRTETAAVVLLGLAGFMMGRMSGAPLLEKGDV